MVATHDQSVAEPVEWPELDWNFRFGPPGTPDSPGQHRDGQPSRVCSSKSVCQGTVYISYCALGD